MAVPNGNKVKNWAIRSQAPNLAMSEYGEGSTTRFTAVHDVCFNACICTEVMGLRELTILDEGLRYSLNPREIFRKEGY